MAMFLTLPATLVALAAAAPGAPPGVAASPTARNHERPTAIEHVTVVGIAGRASIPDATVVTSGRFITAVGPSDRVPVPPGARVIDGRGRFVIPGLWDMHAHTTFPWRARVHNREYFLPLFVAYGVTGVRDMGGDLALLLTWRNEVARGEIIGPHLVVTGEKLGSRPVVPGAPFPVGTADDVRRSVAMLKAGGADFVKLENLDAALLPGLADACREEGIPFVGHVPLVIPAGALSDAGARTVEHWMGILEATSTKGDAIARAMVLDSREDLWARAQRRFGLIARPRDRIDDLVQTFDRARADALFARFARNRTWLTPTLRLFAFLTASHESLLRAPSELVVREASWPGGSREREALLRQRYATFSGVVSDMVRAGGGVLAGSDTPTLNAVPGLSLHEELELLVDAGLSPAQALDSATHAAAEAAGMADSSGAVEAGRIADLVMLDADPSVDIRNTRRIRAVIAGGRVFEREALDSVLSGARARAAVARAAMTTAPAEPSERTAGGRALRGGVLVVAVLLGLWLAAEGVKRVRRVTHSRP